ncbi:hypothetical protein KIPB_012192, partial [Kipferlia bialata]
IARERIKLIFRRLATDKLIMVLIVLVVIAIVASVVVKIVKGSS